MNALQLYIEIVAAIAVVGIQAYFFNKTLAEINTLKNLFPAERFGADSLVAFESQHGPIQLIRKEDSDNASEYNDIVDTINEYLKNNHGSTDFNIIKSIVERSVAGRENVITSSISLPLYVGLMGTFIGIIIGLVYIAVGGVTEGNINSFLGGVVIAMAASFCGLLLTVLNNSKNFKQAKVVCDLRKNAFYNFLQAQLLPHLGNSLFDALDKLKLNITDFNRKFETNISLFDSKFSHNISSLSKSVGSLTVNIEAVVENTQTQKRFLDEIKKIGYNRLAEANIKVFSLIKDYTPTLITFIEKQEDLNNTVGKAAEIITVIEKIMNRIATFEASINNLGETISTRQYLGSEVLQRIDKNLSHLDRSFDVLKKFEDSTADEVERYFKSKYQEIQRLTDGIKKEMEAALDIRIANNPFHKLNHLDSIDLRMTEISNKIAFNGEFSKIERELNRVTSELSVIRQKISSVADQPHRKNGTEDTKKTEKRKKNRSYSNTFNRVTHFFTFRRGRKA